MKNIIFRGKSIYHDEWVYGSLVALEDYCCICPTNVCDGWYGAYADGESGCFDGYMVPVHPYSVEVNIEDGLSMVQMEYRDWEPVDLFGISEQLKGGASWKKRLVPNANSLQGLKVACIGAGKNTMTLRG